MNAAPGRARTYPLTVRWYLAVWRGGTRWRASRIRACGDGEPCTIGVLLSVFGCTVAVGRFGSPPHTTGARFRDFGERFGRYSVGSWRTVRPVPVSAGFMYSGPPRPGSRRPGAFRIGILVTVASRTLCLFRLATAAEVRESRAFCGTLHRRRR
ncbi:hypothetical protein AB0G49_14350 [Streptomyces longwoodensis]|uniref:hypothetical protein n=1 Tax=Streptomyces longwoodensis TaxID=68231 RepID=UPI0033C9D521